MLLVKYLLIHFGCISTWHYDPVLCLYFIYVQKQNVSAKMPIFFKEVFYNLNHFNCRCKFYFFVYPSYLINLMNFCLNFSRKTNLQKVLLHIRWIVLHHLLSQQELIMNWLVSENCLLINKAFSCKISLERSPPSELYWINHINNASFKSVSFPISNSLVLYYSFTRFSCIYYGDSFYLYSKEISIRSRLVCSIFSFT